jgi:hypothetical protein
MDAEKKEIKKEEQVVETVKGPLTDLEVAKKMLNLKQSADSRNIKFDLSFTTLKELMEQKKCFYTGRILETKGDFSLSIDRIDNKLGYVEGNVVACTVDINRKKTDITIEEIEMIYKAIQRSKSKKEANSSKEEKTD